MTTSSEMRTALLDDTRKAARNAFAQHVIASESEGRWVLRRPYADGKGYDSAYWVEISVMAGGYLYVNGDVDLVVFGRGSDSGLGRVSWMARASECYAAEKASIGMCVGGCDSPVYDWEHDIAVQRIREALAPNEDGDAELSVPHCFDDADDVISDLESQDSTAQAFVAWLYEHWEFDDFEGLYDAGRVLSSRVTYAQAALSRLLELVDEREKKEPTT